MGTPCATRRRGFRSLGTPPAACPLPGAGRTHTETEMMKSSLRAAALWAATTGVALAGEGPEGLGEMQGVRPLLYLLAGVTALGLVIWGMVKFLGRK